MWFSVNFSSRSLASLQRCPLRRLLAKTKTILCITLSWKTGRYNQCPDLQQPACIPTSHAGQTWPARLYPHKTRQHNRQIIRVIPVLLKFWITVMISSSTYRSPWPRQTSWTTRTNVEAEIQNPIHLPPRGCPFDSSTSNSSTPDSSTRPHPLPVIKINNALT